jgi:ankyrin repeat protein
MDRLGNGPLHLAARDGTLKDLQRLMPEDARDLHLEARNRDLETPLQLAMQHASLQMVEFLIQRGANVNSESRYDRTPLHNILIWHNDAKLLIAEKLLQSRADVNAITDTGETPLMLSGTAEMSTLLIEHHARVDAVNDDGVTALHFAVMQSYDLTRTLLDAGASVSLRDEHGRTALYDAVSDDDVYIVGLLITYGSDSSTKCEYGHSPASLAALHNNQPMVDAIKTADTLLSLPVEKEILERIMSLAFPSPEEQESENNQHER